MTADHDRAARIARLAVNLGMALHIGEPHLSDLEQTAFRVGGEEPAPPQGRGRHGLDAPLPARIVDVAVAFDALVSGRHVPAADAVEVLARGDVDPLVIGALRTLYTG